jgi:transposase
VPFPNQSGVSIKRDRVSKLANQKLKKLLHMAAMSCIRAHGELKEYFIRKVKEGKNKMLVINAIRNKLVHRMFAVD